MGDFPTRRSGHRPICPRNNIGPSALVKPIRAIHTGQQIWDDADTQRPIPSGGIPHNSHEARAPATINNVVIVHTDGMHQRLHGLPIDRIIPQRRTGEQEKSAPI